MPLNLKLDDPALKEVISEAILSSISQESKAALVDEALKYLLAKPVSTNSYDNRTRLSPIQEAYNDAIYRLAREQVGTLLSEDSELRAKLKALAADAFLAALDKEHDQIVASMASSIAYAFREKER